MTFVSCPDRDRILEADGHVIVTGGPGCGKTTVALRKALVRIGSGLLPGQKVLFLSFSRAAVARIVQAARKDLPKESRRHLDIQTFHSFCWQLVRGHGYLLGAASPIRLLPPHDERAMRNGAKDDDPVWDAERERLFLVEGRIAFDLFAPKALALLQGSAALRKLIADRYPLVIVDEASSGLSGMIEDASPDELLAFVERIDIAPGTLMLTLSAGSIAERLAIDTDLLDEEALVSSHTFQRRKRGVETKIILADAPSGRDETLIRNIARAHVWFEAIKAGRTFDQIAESAGTSKRRAQDIIGLAFLAPEIVRDVLDGKQPIGFTSDWCKSRNLPTDWSDQRELLASL